MNVNRICPRPDWRSLQRSPRPPSGISGDLLIREGGEGKGREGVTVGELKVSPWLTAPGMEDEQLGRRGLSASQPMAERD